MKNLNYIENNYTPKQLKLPIDLEKIIDISDPVYSFCEIMDCLDLSKYVKKGARTGRPRYSYTKLLKIILFAFMENGYCTLRKIEKLCKTDIRYMWMLDEDKAPSFVTINNFIRENLTDNIENIFKEINEIIFEKDKVDLNHAYIDGTKIEANANKYTWVWKKSCINNRNKVFSKITKLIEEINKKDIITLNIKFETRSEYAIEYLEDIQRKYSILLEIDTSKFVHGKGKNKSIYQRRYEQLQEYIRRLKKYSKSIEICGEKRGSYSKTDNDATFMRIKRDYMGNDQLLPAYNIQAAVCDEYIATYDVKQYAADSDCFVPLMEKFHRLYGIYPEYPVADAGYGSLNNYIYCENNNMKKYMKFTMFKKQTEDKKYKNNIFRSVNFKQDENKNIICPNGKRFVFKNILPIQGNNYGRTEEIFECEDCTDCIYKTECSPKSKKNRVIHVNRELTSMHEEVIRNLCSTKGLLLRMNRSIQSEGTFGIIKWNKNYKRIIRRGFKNVILELGLISCGFNLYKYYQKSKRISQVA